MGCFVSVPDVVTDAEGGAPSGGAGGEGGATGGSASVCDAVGVELTVDNQPSEDEKVWHISGLVRRSESLTIPAGTTICAEDSGTSLVIDALTHSGLQVNAVGTSSEPIVFTSKRAEPGSWKGVYIVGNGRKQNTPGTFQAVDLDYGADAGWDSDVGTLTYARLEFAGLHVGAPNVGTFDSISVVSPGGSCFEVFGGGTGMTHLACSSPSVNGWDVASGMTLEYLALRDSAASTGSGIRLRAGAMADVRHATLCGAAIPERDALGFDSNSNVGLRWSLVKDMARFAQGCPPGGIREVTVEESVAFDFASCGMELRDETPLPLACDSFAAMVPSEDVEIEEMPTSYQGAFNVEKGDWTAGWALP